MKPTDRHLKALMRRLAFLEAKALRSDDSPNAMNYVYAEIAALKWALGILKILRTPDTLE